MTAGTGGIGGLPPAPAVDCDGTSPPDPGGIQSVELNSCNLLVILDEPFVGTPTFMVLTVDGVDYTLTYDPLASGDPDTFVDFFPGSYSVPAVSVPHGGHAVTVEAVRLYDGPTTGTPFATWSGEFAYDNPACINPAPVVIAALNNADFQDWMNPDGSGDRVDPANWRLEPGFSIALDFGDATHAAVGGFLVQTESGPLTLDPNDDAGVGDPFYNDASGTRFYVVSPQLCGQTVLSVQLLDASMNPMGDAFPVPVVNTLVCASSQPAMNGGQLVLQFNPPAPSAATELIIGSYTTNEFHYYHPGDPEVLSWDENGIALSDPAVFTIPFANSVEIVQATGTAWIYMHEAVLIL